MSANTIINNDILCFSSIYNFLQLQEILKIETMECLYTESIEYIQSFSLLGVIGLVAVTYSLINIINTLLWTPFKLFLLARVLPGVDFRQLGKWAVVTGGSDGIGKFSPLAVFKEMTLQSKCV